MSLIIAAPRRASDGSRIGHQMDEEQPGGKHAGNIDGEQRQDRVAAFAEIGKAGEIGEHRAGDERGG